MPSNRSAYTRPVVAPDLTYRGGYVVEPARIEFDNVNKFVLQDIFANVAGTPFQSLGLYDSHLMPWPTSDMSDADYYIHDIIIKSPGKNNHTVPDQLGYLQPLIQRIATHENSYGLPFKDTVGLLTLRTSTVMEGESLFPIHWHLPADPTPERIRESMLLLGTPTETEFWLRKRNHQEKISEYIISDPVGIKIQTDFIRGYDTAERLRPGAILRETKFEYRYSLGNEILHGSNYSFRAGTKADKEYAGEKQTTVQIRYIPVLN